MDEIITRQLPVDAIQFCFRRQDDHCDCRKSKPGMIPDAAQELGVNLEKSFMVGDRRSDIEAGHAASCTTVFIDLGYAEPAPAVPDCVVHSIEEAADAIIEIALTAREGL